MEENILWSTLISSQVLQKDVDNVGLKTEGRKMNYDLMTICFIAGIVICIASILNLAFSWKEEKAIDKKFRDETISSMISAEKKMELLRMGLNSFEENYSKLNTFYLKYVGETFLTDAELELIPKRSMELYETVKRLSNTHGQHVKRLMKIDMDLEFIKKKLPAPKRKYKKRVCKKK